MSAVIRDSRTNASDRYEQVKIEIERKSLQADEKIADETEKLAAFTENLAHITAILVIVGAVQIIIFVWQLKEMNKATKVAGKSAQAALKTAEDIAASERAYVFANVKIVDPPTMAPVFPSRIKINFCNLGKTPAIIMMFRAYTVTATGVIHSLPLDSMEGVRHFQEGLVIAGGNIYEVGISPNISSSDIGQVGTGALTFFCCGFIEYKTITEGIRTTGYCWQYDRYPSGHSFIFSHTSKLNHYN